MNLQQVQNKKMMLGILFVGIAAVALLVHQVQQNNESRTRANNGQITLLATPASTTKVIGEKVAIEIFMLAGTNDVTGIDVKFGLDPAVYSIDTFLPSPTFNTPLVTQIATQAGTLRYAAVNTTANQIISTVSLGTLTLTARNQGASSLTLLSSQLTVQGQNTAVVASIQGDTTYTVTAPVPPTLTSIPTVIPTLIIPTPTIVKPTATLTPKPTIQPTRTPTPQPTTRPTRTPTPRPTTRPTSTPKLTVVPTVRPQPSSTTVPTTPITPTSTVTVQTNILLSLFLHGIGKGGDNVNPVGNNPNTPKHPVRTVTLTLTDASNTIVLTKDATVTYQSDLGDFTGTVAINSVPSGSYLLKIKSPGYLSKTVPGIIQIIAGQTREVASVSLIAGDSNNDGYLSVLDFNILFDCYSETAPARNCNDAAKKAAADLNDDGNVNRFDFNLFLRELSLQRGQ